MGALRIRRLDMTAETRKDGPTMRFWAWLARRFPNLYLAVVFRNLPPS